MTAAIIGNSTLDIICFPVGDVPRHDSISFETAAISPGGCASNTAIGLASLGLDTYLISSIGSGDAADLVLGYWANVGVNTKFVRRVANGSTGVSVGLVDSDYQPRFVHTPGANRALKPEHLEINELSDHGVDFIHVAGFFVLPGLLDNKLSLKLSAAKNSGIRTSLDVVFNTRMDDDHNRTILWNSMPFLDFFMCNRHEAFRLSGKDNPNRAAAFFQRKGAATVIIKMGDQGCLVFGNEYSGICPSIDVEVIDTTGAGDAFAAGLIFGLSSGLSVVDACHQGNLAGSRIVQKMGAITAWMDDFHTDKSLSKNKR